jgi:hypothetical protein
MALNYQISSPETMERAICELGIVPFFTSAIPGYSIKELTQPGFWFDVFLQSNLLSSWALP